MACKFSPYRMSFRGVERSETTRNLLFPGGIPSAGKQQVPRR